MLDRIVLSRDRREAMIVTDDKTFTLYHSEGRVMELVTEMVLEPMARLARAEEKTQEIELQMSFDLSEPVEPLYLPHPTRLRDVA